MTQSEALSIMKTGANVFLTGEPGSGKTHTVNAFVSWLREHGIEPAITASTGIAATHIGGFTIHSWSGIGIKSHLSAYDIDQLASNESLVKRVRAVHTLIIDEVSMLSANLLSMVDAALRAARGNESPFGGLQIIFVGDFFQLPPVEKAAEQSGPRDLFSSSSTISGNKRFAFQSPAWAAAKPIVCYLSEQHRQEDEGFLEILAAIRRREVKPHHREMLSARAGDEQSEWSADITRLFSHNVDVDRLNDGALGQIEEEAHVFEMESEGPERLVTALKKGCLSPETLSLKRGARVMFTKNNFAYGSGGYVNGTLGTVADFSSEGWPIVETKDGTIVAEPVDWHVEDSGRILARIIQVPLRLAWAITVHKSQGMSLDAAHMDLSQTFEYGQGYVALSRVRSLSGLTLHGMNERALQVHPDVAKVDDDFRAASAAAEQAFSAIDADELQKMHENFIRASGGSVERVESEKEGPEKGGKNRSGRGAKKSGGKGTKGMPKEKSWRTSYDLIASGKTIAQAAKERELNPRTILGHLDEAKAAGVLAPADIAHLVRGQEKEITAIKAAFAEQGSGLLKPVYDHFGGQYEYELIQLARLLLKD